MTDRTRAIIEFVFDTLFFGGILAAGIIIINTGMAMI